MSFILRAPSNRHTYCHHLSAYLVRVLTVDTKYLSANILVLHTKNYVVRAHIRDIPLYRAYLHTVYTFLILFSLSLEAQISFPNVARELKEPGIAGDTTRHDGNNRSISHEMT